MNKSRATNRSPGAGGCLGTLLALYRAGNQRNPIVTSLDPMTTAIALQLKARFRLKDVPESTLLAELLDLEFSAPGVTYDALAGGLRLNLTLDTCVDERQKALLLDVLRAVDPLLSETVYVRGQIGDTVLSGYLGPEKAEKEQSRARLDEIRKQAALLMPEHREALRHLLHTD
jgi:hypothetical protein